MTAAAGLLVESVSPGLTVATEAVLSVRFFFCWEERMPGEEIKASARERGKG